LLKDHEHEHGHHHQEDYNLKAAYLHVLADALTSILAIVALVFGKTLGWVWMDALMGLVGAAVIARWSVDLMRRTGGILLDRTADEHVSGEIRELIEADPDDKLVDVHLWKINADQFAAALTIASKAPKTAQAYRDRLEPVHELAHLTVEVHPG
jgi:cation diffusion facilitator family transporter